MPSLATLRAKDNYCILNVKLSFMFDVVRITGFVGTPFCGSALPLAKRAKSLIKTAHRFGWRLNGSRLGLPTRSLAF
jgi:hypothetical protein